MKAILMAMTVLFSGAAFAGEFTDFGKIHFQAASTWVESNKVCQAGGMYYHTKKAVQEKYECNDSGSNCRVWTTIPLVQPIESTRQRCAVFTGGDEGGCARWETVRYKQGPVVDVKTYASMHDWEENRNPIAVRKFTIPACKTKPGVPAN